MEIILQIADDRARIHRRGRQSKFCCLKLAASAPTEMGRTRSGRSVASRAMTNATDLPEVQADGFFVIAWKSDVQASSRRMTENEVYRSIDASLPVWQIL